MWKRIMSALLILALCLTLLPVAVFAEPEEDVLADENNQTGAVNLMAAPANGETYSRGEWVHELVSLFGLKLAKDEYPDIYFPDIVGTTYFDDIMVATKFGLISVEAGDDFRPDDPATREFAAQTLNYKLGIINEKKSYSYSDSADVTFRDDAQVAVDQGWFALSNGKFMPEQGVTEAEKNAMFASAKDILKTKKPVANFEFADWVKTLPDSVDVQSRFDPDTDAQTITITGYDGTLASGDTFVYYYQGFAFVHAVDTVSQQGDSYIVTVKEPPEGAVLKYEYSGTIQPEITEIIPDEESVTLMTADGEVTLGPVELMASDGFNKDFSRPFTLPDGTTGNLTARISNVTINTKVDASEVGFDFEGDLELGSTLTLQLLENPEYSSIPLGQIVLGGFGHAGLSLDLSAQATLGFSYKAHFLIGVTHFVGSGITSTHKSWDEAESNHLSADGEFAAMLTLGAYLSFGDSSASAEIKAGPILNAGFKFYPSGTPSRCFNADGYFSAEASAEYTLKTPDIKGPLTGNTYVKGEVVAHDKWKQVFFDRRNSPVRFIVHMEDDKLVEHCTRENDQGTIKGNYTVGKYATPANSRYYSSIFGNGSSIGYGGYGSDPVVIWETKDNDDGTVTITKYNGHAMILNIPETIDGKTVTGIDNHAFRNNVDLRMVTVPDTVTSIGYGAFNGCSNISNVQLSKSLVRIGAIAFQNCTSLTNIELPEGLQTLGTGGEIGNVGGAFRGCTSLKSVSIPSTLTSGNSGYYGGNFEGCTQLQTIIWGEDITDICAGLFFNCGVLSFS